MDAILLLWKRVCIRLVPIVLVIGSFANSSGEQYVDIKEMVVEGIKFYESSVREVYTEYEEVLEPLSPTGRTYTNKGLLVTDGNCYYDQEILLDKEQKPSRHIEQVWDGERQIVVEIPSGDLANRTDIINLRRIRISPKREPPGCVEVPTRYTPLYFQEFHEQDEWNLSKYIAQSRTSFVLNPDYVWNDTHCILLAVDASNIPGLYYTEIVINPEKSFLPVSVCSYKQDKDGNRVKLHTLDTIKVEKFGEIWFPVEGVRTFWKTNSAGEVVPGLRKRTIVKNVKLNQGLLTDKLKYEFQYGDAIWDEFIGMGYFFGISGFGGS